MATPPSDEVEVEAPSLEGLRVTVPSPGMVMKEHVVARIEKLRRELGAITMLAAGEAVAPGDEVLVDVVGYSKGRVLPFTAAVGKVLELKPDPELPGLAEGIVGMAVGTAKRIALQLPPTWSELPQRLAEAHFDVELRGARRVTRAQVMDPAFLQRLGCASLDELGQRVGKQLEQEWRLEAEGRAVKEVVAKLTSRVSYRPAPADVDAEIEARWVETEGRLLARRGVPEDLQRESRDAWLAKPRLREEVAQQLKEARVLAAIAEREGVEVNPATLLQDAAPVLAARGIFAEQAKAAWEQDPAFRAQLTEQVRRYKTVELVMSRARAKVSDNIWGI